MDITAQDMLAEIGALTLENKALRGLLASAEQQLQSLQPPTDPTEPPAGAPVPSTGPQVPPAPAAAATV